MKELASKSVDFAFESGFSYTCHHIPTNEDWHILGVDIKNGKVCAAGWPPSIAKISDCKDFEKTNELTGKELDYRNFQFGHNWL